MSHLSRRYTDHFYREDGKGKNRKLVKVAYRENLNGTNPMIAVHSANAVFPCEHEERGFLSRKGRKTNHTHVRYKRKNKARFKARKAA